MSKQNMSAKCSPARTQEDHQFHRFQEKQILFHPNVNMRSRKRNTLKTISRQEMSADMDPEEMEEWRTIFNLFDVDGHESITCEVKRTAMAPVDGT